MITPTHKGFPCSTDLTFYQSKRTPAWAQRLRPQAIATIDDCVNAHAGEPHLPGPMAAGSLLAILASYQRRGKDLHRELVKLAQHPECAIHPEKRAAFARKWAARLGRKPPPPIVY